MQDTQNRLYHTKLTLLALVLVVVGGILLFVGNEPLPGFMAHWPVKDIGSSLFTTGVLGVALYYLDARDGEQRDTERLKRVLHDSAPEMRDAVVRGFAVQPEDLARVATPELLDQIATNALSLRLGDNQFASEVYADVRDLAIRAPERWYDVDVSVRLSSMDESSTSGAALLAVLVTWEYTVTPKDSVRRFACTSDMDEFHELVQDIPTTSTWFMSARPGTSPASRDNFELLSFSVDGELRKIRRTERKNGQVYSVDVGDDVASAGEPVRVRHTYRAVTDPTNHRLFLAIAQPARDVTVEVDYSDTDLSRMSVTDLVPSGRRPYVSQLPAQATGKELTIEVPGWLQAGTGFTFVWTRTSEETAPAQSARPIPPTSAA